jgi:hypothetical protein
MLAVGWQYRPAGTDEAILSGFEREAILLILEILHPCQIVNPT